MHPQSFVHAMIRLDDGSLLTHCGPPDMRVPIGFALRWPDPPPPAPQVDLVGRRLDFDAADEEAFRCLPLAREAGRTGGTAPAVLNAANEVAVQAFLDGRIGFLDIAALVERALGEIAPVPADSLDTVLDADRSARASVADGAGGARVTGVNIVVFVVIMIVLILLHEFGHLIVAKMCGMRVERFSVFFGRPIWSVRRGETEYGIGWMPLGGYVKITGMTREELVQRVHDPETGKVIEEIPEPPEVQARAYCNSTTPRKVATIAAGPAANVLVAIIAFAISFWIGQPQFAQTNVVRSVNADTPAATAGLQAGDRIVSINGVTANGNDPTPLRDVLQRNVGKSVTLEVQRDGQPVRIVTPPLVPDAADPSIGRLGFGFDAEKVGTVRFGAAGGFREALQYTGFVTREQVRGARQALHRREDA